MPGPSIPIPHDPRDLPERIDVTVVQALAGYGRVTLWRRIRRGEMPKHVDRGAHGQIFMRDPVLKALGIIGPEAPAQSDFDPWIESANAIREGREPRFPKGWRT